MALNKSKTEELPFPIEGIDEEPQSEQISFDDLEFEAEYVDEEELETKKFYTISGKESWYEPTWEKMKATDLDVGDEFEGRPEINIFENKDKTYDALRVRVYDDPAEEILDAYLNFPKADENGYIENITKGFDFYRTCFDFIFSILRCKGDKYVLDKNGEEYNKFKRVNIHQFAKYVDQQTTIRIKITEGNTDSGYNSWEIIEME